MAHSQIDHASESSHGTSPLRTNTVHHVVWAFGFTEAKTKRGPFWLMVALTFLVQVVVTLSLNDSSPKPLWIDVALLGMCAANVYAWLVITAGRCRDAGLSGWLALLTLIPLVGLIGVVMIGISGSESED